MGIETLFLRLTDAFKDAASLVSKMLHLSAKDGASLGVKMLHVVVVFFYILSSIYICARVEASFHVIFDTENSISMSQPIPILTTKQYGCAVKI